MTNLFHGQRYESTLIDGAAYVVYADVNGKTFVRFVTRDGDFDATVSDLESAIEYGDAVLSAF